MANKRIQREDLHGMNFNEDLETDIFGHQVFIKRVPGGWIYSMLWVADDGTPRPTSVFVPFDNEFQR